jgi:BirA family biotin operon repressor/biotin-[acetyl-CoA-carboxylase] ligase
MYDRLDINAIRQRLCASILGREIVYTKKTVSTNRDALRLAKDGAADGTVVIAEEQTGGRGRLNRTWISRAGENVLMSIILRPHIALESSFQLTMIASLAVVSAIEEVAGLKATIKWPNDLFVGGRKVCGILTELHGEGRFVAVAVVGIGINVGSNPNITDPNVAPATNLVAESGKSISRTALIGALLESLDSRYQMLQHGDPTAIINDWMRHSLIIGKLVTVSDAHGSIRGVAESIDAEGRLILLLSDGTRKKIISGDVTLRLRELPDR